MDDKEEQVITTSSLPSSEGEVRLTNTGTKHSSSDEKSGTINECRDTSQTMNSHENLTQHSSNDLKTLDSSENAKEVLETLAAENISKNSPSSHVNSKGNVSDSTRDFHNELDAIKPDSRQCDLNQDKTGPSQDNPTPSLDSSPTTPSTSGQDSGVSLLSPDDSSCETAAGLTNKCLESATTAEQSKAETDLKDKVQGQSVDSNVAKDLTPVGGNKIFNTAADDSSIAASSAEVPDQVSVYYIKWVLFGTNKVPIITQNENGPCPLLAIMNVLLLKGKVTLAPMLEMVTSEQLMAYLADCIFENMPQNLPAVTKANYEQNMQDAMGVMDKLQTGLDVNVKFTGCGDFEYTSELIIFDLLEISLYHGWLVDPQDSSTVQAINQCSYNQLVEKIISLKQSEKESDVRHGLIAEQFLDRTASQLTYHGLCEMSSVVKDSELCVFFRNNHFNTLYKHNNELFILVTDQGFLTESNVVWETLSNVDGDGHFVDASFRTYTKPLPPTQPIPDPSVPVGSPEQIDHDYQVALSLQEEDVPAPPSNWPEDQDAAMLADHEYALRLQEQENQRAAEEQQRMAAPLAGQAAAAQGQGRQQAPGSSQADSQRRRAPERVDKKEKEGRDCSIL